MNARVKDTGTRPRHAPAMAVALLGTGAVGGTLLEQLATRTLPGIRLVAVASSSRQTSNAGGLEARTARATMLHAPAGREDSSLLAALDASGASHRVIVDATASDDVAARHPFWLARGYHVVTANKALAGGRAAGWEAMTTACSNAGTQYGMSATVGAGLPVIDTLQRWRTSGDQLRCIEGVFSGSLSWLFNAFDRAKSFAALVHEARRRGYCEPDPRADLEGIDVVRKLLILARCAGLKLTQDQVTVENFVPENLRALTPELFARQTEQLDEPLLRRREDARSSGQVLRHVARLDSEGAHVGLITVPASHPAAGLEATDTLFMLSSESYREQPIVIRGPGAGKTVTAQALLADITRLVPR